MADGSWKPIEAVLPGESVYSLQNNEKFVQRRVLATKEQSLEDEVFVVKTRRRAFKANARHPVLSESGNWIKVEDLKIGEPIAISNKVNAGGSKYTEEFAWMFGFLLGDGWVTKVTRPQGTVSYCVCVAKSEYPELNARIVNSIESVYKCRVYETKFGYYRADCNAAGRELESLGLKKPAKEKTIPDWCFTDLSDSQKIALLDGLLEADGNVRKSDPRTRILGVASRRLAETARDLAMTCGIRCANVTSYTQLVQPPNSSAPIESTIYRCPFTFGVSDSDVVYERVTDIIRSGTSKVYDLTIDETENFVVEGIVVHNTRWHPEDLIGQLTSANPEMWQYINLPAISDTNTALWPTRWPLHELVELKSSVGEYEWASQYMGQPRPRGGAVFKDVQYYDELPRITATCIGIDLAYTNKTYADYSCAVVLGRGDDKRYYVLDVVRKQAEPPAFATELNNLSNKHGTRNIFWYISGVEKGVIPFLKNSRVNVRAEVTNKDKFTRSIDVAAAWNRGDVLLPKDAPWLDSFISEVVNFTGINDAKDDQVDALAAAYSQIGAKSTVRVLGTQKILPF
jgi:predicted phage terminase large subunit-like protein